VEAKHETVELLLMLKEKMEIVSFVGTNGIGGSDSATTSSTKHWLRQQQKDVPKK
jgi:signal recognition particle GTPase